MRLQPGPAPTDAIATGSDGISRATRALALFIIPFLIVAAIILYIWPTETDRLFAWPMKPPMTAMTLAAGYMGGIYFFARVVTTQRWHAIAAGFLPVTAFTGLLGMATLLHWDKFTHSHPAFIAWAGLYFTTPFLVLAAWLANRHADPGRPAENDVLMAHPLDWLLAALGAVTLIVSLLLFLFPTNMIAVWPWTLTPLTARVMGALFALPGVLGLELAGDPRFSTARIMLEAQAVSFLAIWLALARAWNDINHGTPGFWLFVLSLLGLSLGIVALYAGLARRSRLAQRS